MTQNIGLSAIGGGLAVYGLTLIAGDFYKGLIGICVGCVMVVIAGILNSKGVIVGK
jgi:hypothetical protein